MMHQTLCGELATRGSDWALAAYKDFRILWKDADPDLPIPQGSQGGNRTYAYIGWRFGASAGRIAVPIPRGAHRDA